MVNLSDFFFLHPSTCPICKANEVGDGGICLACMESLDPLRGYRTLEEGFVCDYPYFYNASLRQWIARFKFQGQRALAEPLAGLLAQEVQDRHLFDGLDLLTWIPSHPKALRKRGYNPAEDLCKALALQVGLPARAALKKTRSGPPQSSLDEPRRLRNLKGAFALKEGIDLQGRSICIIDDILTTGSTLIEAHRVLKTAGPLSIRALVLASARGHGEKGQKQSPDLL